MRAMLTLAALFACAGLFGCDDDSPKSAGGAISAATAAPACKCKQTAQAEPATHEASASRHRVYHHPLRHHAHFAYAHGRGSAYEIGWGSGSRSMHSGSSHSQYAMADNGPPPPPPGAFDNMPPPPPAPYPPPPPSGAGPADSGIWVDGYGRGHFADGEAAPSPNGNMEYLSNADSAKRHDPWRGFNSKCRNTAVD